MFAVFSAAVVSRRDDPGQARRISDARRVESSSHSARIISRSSIPATKSHKVREQELESIVKHQQPRQRTAPRGQDKGDLMGLRQVLVVFTQAQGRSASTARDLARHISGLGEIEPEDPTREKLPVAMRKLVRELRFARCRINLGHETKVKLTRSGKSRLSIDLHFDLC
jgi:hypothetical protein